MGMKQIASDRRRFLGAATLGIGLGVGAIGSPGTAAVAAAPRNDLGVIQTALALEHEGIAAYRIAGESGLLSPGTLAVAGTFMGHHQQHRDSLARLVTQLGGSPVEPKTDAQYAADLALAKLTSEGDVVALATTLERGAASAYIGQIASLQDPKLARLFASLAADEAVHWTTLANAAGTPVPAAAYLFG
jgi:hypothetical protein